MKPKKEYPSTTKEARALYNKYYRMNRNAGLVSESEKRGRMCKHAGCTLPTEVTSYYYCNGHNVLTGQDDVTEFTLGDDVCSLL